MFLFIFLHLNYLLLLCCSRESAAPHCLEQLVVGAVFFRHLIEKKSLLVCCAQMIYSFHNIIIRYNKCMSHQSYGTLWTKRNYSSLDNDWRNNYVFIHSKSESIVISVADLLCFKILLDLSC